MNCVNYSIILAKNSFNLSVTGLKFKKTKIEVKFDIKRSKITTF